MECGLDHSSDKSARVDPKPAAAAPTSAVPTARVQFERTIASRPVNEQIQLLRPSPGIQLTPAMDWRAGMPLESGSPGDGEGGNSGPPVQLTPSTNNQNQSGGNTTSGSSAPGSNNQGGGNQTPSPFAGKTPLQIIKDECGANWDTVKTKVLREQEDTPLMERLCEFRKEHVNGIIRQIKASPGFSGLGFQSLGSEAPTSDYDLSFSGKGAVYAVVLFNRIFRQEKGWGKESGTVFDTNVYAESILRATKEQERNEPLLPVGNEEGKKLDAFYQDVAALTKVRRYMTARQWVNFRSAVVTPITDAAVQAETARRLNLADEAQLAYEDALHAEIIRLYPSARETYPSLSREELVRKITQEHEDAAIQASNRLYEQKLLQVIEKTRDRETEAKKCTSDAARDELINRYNAEIRALHSDALTFANEPYFASGSLRHVVGNIQGKYGIDLSASDLFQSLTENYGDAKKDFEKYGGKSFGYAAYRSSKYVYRLTDAAKLLADNSDGKVTLDGGASTTRGLSTRSEKLLKIRQSETLDSKNYANVPDAEKEADAAAIANPYRALSAIERDVDRIVEDINRKARTFGVGT